MTENHPWFYADRDQTFGPVDAQEIERLMRQAVISSSTWMLAEGSENWMLAKDSPFAAHLGNASSQPGPQDQGPVDSIPNLVQPDSPSSVEGEQPSEGLSAKFSELGAALLSETKRSARLASIKAVIEKLRRVDLTKAHYALGKKAYELKIDQDRFSDQYREILVLEETIRVKKAGNAPNESATVMENFRGVALNAKSAVEAEAFEIKRKQWFIKIGAEYRPSTVPTALQTEFVAVGRVEAQIREREAEYASVSADQKSFITLLRPSRPIFPKTGMHASWRFLMLLAVCALIYFITRSDAQLPNRGSFTQALATAHIVSDAEGQIIIGDKWNQKLILEIRLDDPRDPQSYKIVARGEPLKISYDDFANLPSADDTHSAIPPVLARNQEISLGPPEPSDLASAVDTLVNWSITAVESKTTAIQRRVSGDDYNRYIVQGVQRANEYILVYAWMPRLSLDELNSYSEQPRGAAYPVTDYAHAHLWKYLFDHYDEVKVKADAYYIMAKEEATKASSLRSAAVQNAQALEQKKVDSAAGDKAAERSRLNQLFPVPPSAKPSDRQ